MPITIISTRVDGSFSGRYSDADARMLLFTRSRELVDAESAVRVASTRLDAVIAACRRNGQGALVDEALRDLQARRA